MILSGSTSRLPSSSEPSLAYTPQWETPPPEESKSNFEALLAQKLQPQNESHESQFQANLGKLQGKLQDIKLGWAHPSEPSDLLGIAPHSTGEPRGAQGSSSARPHPQEVSHTLFVTRP